MKCANPNCQSSLLYLRGGTLRLLELEPHPEDGAPELSRAPSPVHAPARYFWLCSHCSHIFRLSRWTARGLLLESLDPSAEQERTVLVDPQPAVNPSSVFHFRRRPARAAS